MHRNILKLLPFALCLSLAWPNLARADMAPGASLASFDLFTFPLSAADFGLGKRAAALGQALAQSFPKVFKVETFKENNYYGRCFTKGPDYYQLSWMDSETEGFRFTVTRLKDKKKCMESWINGESYPSSSLDPRQFFPVSRSHPGIQLGASDAAAVQKELGKPAHSSPTKLIYVLKRDKEKEKGCGYTPSTGDFAAVEIQFDFSEGVLQSITMLNSISGEC